MLRSSCSYCNNNRRRSSAGCTEQEEKKVKKKPRTSKAATSGPDVRVNSHVAAITVVLFTTKPILFFSLLLFKFFFRTNFYSFNLCTQLFTGVIYAIRVPNKD